MEGRRFYIVDVFAEEKYAGNQLAVIRDSEGLSQVEMQRIAREMNFSETTFIISDEVRDGGYDVRIFTPEREIPFAGHPTLETAYIIAQEVERRPIGQVRLNLKVGQIPVTFDRGSDSEVLWMKQISPTFGSVLDPARVCEVLGVGVDELDERFPIQEVSTGLPFIITPLRRLETVRRIRPARDRFLALVQGTEAKDILVFCPETYGAQNHLNVRVFAEYEGVPEDPATGSANGCLAAYLVKHRFFGADEIDLRVEQGYEIGRPSLLLLRAKETVDKIDVAVGGRVVMVARGHLV